MTSKHLWIAELQDRDGKAVEYHSLELEEEHYASRLDFNRAMTSWSAFRQRERGNLKCNRPRNSRCKWACSWMMPDCITFIIDGVPEMPLHKTIWDLYAAIGYDYKAKKYDRPVVQRVASIDPGVEQTNIAVVEFETAPGAGIPVKVRSITSNQGSAFIIDPKEEEKVDNEVKRMRGDTPGIAHLDESGFLNKEGNPIYVASGDGKREFMVEVEGQMIPMKAEQAPAAPAECEFHGVDVEACTQHGCLETPTPSKGGNVIQNIAQNIADKVNAEPDVEAKKRLLAAELKHYASEEERLADAEHIRRSVRMPQDVKNDPRVIYQKKAVVKQHRKLLRQQAKKQKQKELQLKAFGHGK